MEETTNTLTNILASAGEVLESVVGWVPKVAQVVVSEPLLLIGFTISLGLIGIKVFQRLRG